MPSGTPLRVLRQKGCAMERSDLEALSEDERVRLPKGERMFLTPADLSGEADKVGREISDLVNATGLSASRCHDLILEGNAVEIAILISQKPSALVNGGEHTTLHAENDDPNSIRSGCWSPGLAAQCVLDKGHEGQHVAWSVKDTDLRWDQGAGRG